MTAIDPQSDKIVLKHDGSGRGAGNAPARDLTEHDIARLVYRRQLDEVNDTVGRLKDPEDPDAGVIERPDPRKPPASMVDVLVDELVASGHYNPPTAKTKAAKAAAQEDAQEDVTQRQERDEREAAKDAEAAAAAASGESEGQA